MLCSDNNSSHCNVSRWEYYILEDFYLEETCENGEKKLKTSSARIVVSYKVATYIRHLV